MQPQRHFVHYEGEALAAAWRGAAPALPTERGCWIPRSRRVGGKALLDYLPRTRVVASGTPQPEGWPDPIDDLRASQGLRRAWRVSHRGRRSSTPIAVGRPVSVTAPPKRDDVPLPRVGRPWSRWSGVLTRSSRGRDVRKLHGGGWPGVILAAARLWPGQVWTASSRTRQGQRVWREGIRRPPGGEVIVEEVETEHRHGAHPAAEGSRLKAFAEEDGTAGGQVIHTRGHRPDGYRKRDVSG